MTQSVDYSVQDAQKPTEDLLSISLRISESGSMYVIHKAAAKQLTEKRQGSAHCKTRSEVRGGGKKPWKQKGTGRARAGSSRSPLWRGGGIIFGPKTKKYHQKVNKKERRLAIRNLLFNKKDFTRNIQSDVLQLKSPKTKALIENIKKINIQATENILIIAAKKNQNAYLASRNLKNVEIIAANQINLLSIIKAKWILIETDSMKIIADTYNE